MLITQTKGIRLLKQATGRSIAFCATQIRALPKIQDGERFKISSASLQTLIRDLNTPPQIKQVEGVKPVKPLSAKHKAIFRATAITRQVIENLKARASAGAFSDVKEQTGFQTRD